MIILNGDLFILMGVDGTFEMNKDFLDEPLVQINFLQVIWKKIKDRVKKPPHLPPAVIGQQLRTNFVSHYRIYKI